MTAPKHAVEFDRIIDAGRERKKNEALAARIFNRDGGRRSSTPVRTGSPGAGSLASRVGVKKRPSSTTRASAGNVHGEWAHDLHNNSNQKAKRPAPNSLAARIHAPGTAAPIQTQVNKPKPNRTAKLAQAYNRTTSSPAVMQHSVNMRQGQQQQGPGMSIRGLAGPFTIMAQNFAPGTTAADIESAMTPVGGLITTCRLVKAHPIVIAEIVFENREGAERVIQTFNNQNADGRTLHVYAKPGMSGTAATYSPAPGNAPSAPRALRSNGNIVDGSMGFDDPMEGTATSHNTSRGRQGNNNSKNNSSNNKNSLYSDSMVIDTSNQPQRSNRRGRGFKSRGGGAGR